MNISKNYYIDIAKSIDPLADVFVELNVIYVKDIWATYVYELTIEIFN